MDDEPEYIHVYPLFGREHELIGLTCWCHPKQDEEVPAVVVHQVQH